MNSSIQKKRTDFANKIRSQQKQAIFERERKKLLQAQSNGDIELENLIMDNLIEQFGTEAQVNHLFQQYEQYQKSREQYEDKLEEDEEASMNFQRLQQQKKLQNDRKLLQQLFKEMDQDENQPTEIKDIEI